MCTIWRKERGEKGAPIAVRYYLPDAQREIFWANLYASTGITKRAVFLISLPRPVKEND